MRIRWRLLRILCTLLLPAKHGRKAFGDARSAELNGFSHSLGLCWVLQAWGLGSAGPPDVLGWGARTPEAGLRGWLLRTAAGPASSGEGESSAGMTAQALRRLLSLEARPGLPSGP